MNNSESTKKIKKNHSYFLGKEKDYFIENLAMLIDTGIDISKALNSIKEESKSGAMKKIIQGMQDEVENGSSLWEAIENSGAFSKQAISLIKVGEGSGKLIDNLRTVAKQQEKENDFKSKVRASTIYPIFVFFFTLVIGIMIIWFILPRLSSVFTQMDVQLPLITRILIATGNFLGHYGYFIVPIFLIVVFTIIFLFFVLPSTKFIGESIIFRIPGLRKLVMEAELSRFGYIMGTLLTAGIPLVDALDSLSQASAYHQYQHLYEFIKDKVDEGKSFHESFALYKPAQGLIPSSVRQMIVTGEQSGRLPETFLKVSDIFEKRIEGTTKDLAAILEPILLIIVWFGVLIIALAIILPIYSLIGGVNQ